MGTRIVDTTTGADPLDICFGGGVPASPIRDVLPPFPSIPTTPGGFARGEFYVLYVPSRPKLTSSVFMLGQTATPVRPPMFQCHRCPAKVVGP